MIDFTQVNFLEKWKKVTEATSSGYKVLNHGDFWVNNFLFKYEGGQPKDVVFVDYQISWHASPGVDLNYFLNTSPKYEVRVEQREAIIAAYHDSFANTLSRLGATVVPTLAQLQQEIQTYEYIGFIAAIGVQPLVLLDKQAASATNSSFETMNDTNFADALKKALYFNPTYQKAMQYYLLICERDGVLETFNQVALDK